MIFLIWIISTLNIFFSVSTVSERRLLLHITLIFICRFLKKKENTKTEFKIPTQTKGMRLSGTGHLTLRVETLAHKEKD